MMTAVRVVLQATADTQIQTEVAFVVSVAHSISPHFAQIQTDGLTFFLKNTHMRSLQSYWIHQRRKIEKKHLLSK